jgi:hypothetical protein
MTKKNCFQKAAVFFFRVESGYSLAPCYPKPPRHGLFLGPKPPFMAPFKFVPKFPRAGCVTARWCIHKSPKFFHRGVRDCQREYIHKKPQHFLRGCVYITNPQIVIYILIVCCFLAIARGGNFWGALSLDSHINVVFDDCYAALFTALFRTQPLRDLVHEPSSVQDYCAAFFTDPFSRSAATQACSRPLFRTRPLCRLVHPPLRTRWPKPLFTPASLPERDLGSRHSRKKKKTIKSRTTKKRFLKLLKNGYF